MDSEVFKPAPSGKQVRNAFAGGDSAKYFCARGYDMAAEQLMDYAVKTRVSPDKHALFFPICFCYRHYIELSLKESIILTEEYYPVLKEFGSTRGKLQSVKADLTASKGHHLLTLVGWLDERLKRVSRWGFDKDTRKVISRFDEMDPSGMAFRYPTDKDWKLFLENGKLYDLATIQSSMKKVHAYLDGLGTYLKVEHEQAIEELALSKEYEY